MANHTDDLDDASGANPIDSMNDAAAAEILEALKAAAGEKGLVGDLKGDLMPRLESSKQWTALPAEFLAKVQKIFADQFPIESQHGSFVIEGRIYPDELVMRAGYLESGRLRQINFEASMDLPKDKASKDGEAQSKTMTQIYACMDALGSTMEEYFDLGDEGQIDIPTKWQSFDFEGDTIYLQHSTVNSLLEDEANRLLGLFADGLMNESASSEDALGNAEIDEELAFEVSARLARAHGTRRRTSPIIN